MTINFRFKYFYHHHLLFEFEFNSFKKCLSSCFIDIALLSLLVSDDPKIGSDEMSVVDADDAFILTLLWLLWLLWFVFPIVLKMASYCFCGRFTKSFTFGTVSVVLKNMYR